MVQIENLYLVPAIELLNRENIVVAGADSDGKSGAIADCRTLERTDKTESINRYWYKYLLKERADFMNSSKKVNVIVNAKNVVGKLDHSWRYIGYDECNYTHTPEGEELINKIGELDDAPYYIRAHHMLCTGNCHGTYKWGSTNAYLEDEEGNPIYNWEVIDEILDVYLKYNCKPFFELGFMPMDLVDPSFAGDVNQWDRYGDYKRTGWAAPPKDYDKWKELIYNLVKHCVEKYGEEEVLSWYWELWNEPDIFYWKGTVDEFCKLYDYTESAVHLALDGARLGGPATTGPVNNSNSSQFLDKFLKHCSSGTNYVTGKKGTRLDYVTFHVKGGGFPFEINAAKETPSIKFLVAQVKEGLEIIKENGFSDCEVVLSEADPDGWAAGGMYDNPNMNFRNTEYYATYVASSYKHIKNIADSMDMDVRPLAWAFMFRGERCFEGTRTYTTQGIDKAIFNLFKIYGRLGHYEIDLKSSQEQNVLEFVDKFGTGEEPEISGIAVLKEQKTVQVVLYSHHDDWDIENDFAIDLVIENIPIKDNAVVRHYRIDKNYSNAYYEWLKQGSPKYPNEKQYEAINSKAELELLEPEKELEISNNRLNLKFNMPAHAISFIEICGVE